VIPTPVSTVVSCGACSRLVVLEYVLSPGPPGDRQLDNAFVCPHCAAVVHASLPGVVIGADAPPSPEDILAAVRRWQAGWRNPLTCARDAAHGRLAPIVLDDIVTLICPCCDYTQTFIPPEIWQS
jgi:hypothetical protein